jgi:hypothetical protein
VILSPLLGMLASAALGWALVRRLSPPSKGDVGEIVFRGSIALTLGLGLGSCLHFLYLATAAGRDSSRIIWASVELAQVAAALWIGLRPGRPAASGSGSAASAGVEPDGLPFPALLGWSAATAVLLASCRFVLMAVREPHGDWDAWAIWNLRARFLYLGGERWTDAFSPALSATHPGYPGLLPLTVARLWTYLGSPGAWLPAAVAFLFAAAAGGLLFGSVASVRGRSRGAAALLFLLAAGIFLRGAAHQAADLPLAAFVLGAMVLAGRGLGSGAPGLLVLAGGMAGCAAWTKDEGILFALASVLVLGTVALRRSGARAAAMSLAAFGLGILPFLVSLAAWKSIAAAGNPLFSGSISVLTARAVDPDRHLAILRGIGSVLARNRMALLLAVWALVLGIDRSRLRGAAAAFGLPVLTILIAGYYAAYLITPYDLEWHLRNSRDRLFLQVWPAAVFLAFAVLRSIPDGKEALAKGTADRHGPSALRGSPAGR